MRRYRMLLLVFVCLLPGLRAVNAQAEGGSCTPAQFLGVFELVIDYQQRLASAPSDFSALMDFSQRYAAERLGSLRELPPCAEALQLGALLVALGADHAANAALQLAGTPAAANPYLSLPSADQRINDMLEQTLDPARTTAAADAGLPACAADDLAAYAAARDELLALLAKPADLLSRTGFAVALQELLAWRAETVPSLPRCAETVALPNALTAAVSDSAASLSFAIVGVPVAQNTFLDLLESSRASVKNWQAPAAPASAGKGKAIALKPAARRGLPPCSRRQLDAAITPLRDAFNAAAASSADALTRARNHLDTRASLLADLPICREIFEANWWLDEWLGAPTSRSRSRLDAALSALDSAPAPALSQSAACSLVDMRVFSVYIAPAYHTVMRSALSVSDADAHARLRAESASFRELLFEHAPPCEETAALSLQMRRAAADFVAMLDLEAAGLPAIDIPYLLALPAALADLAQRLADMNALFGYGDSTTWFVDVQGYANVRSCGSTSCGVVAVVAGGDPLDVLDDSGEWFKIRLPSGGDGYIAAFLVSATPTG